jgi:hypothetical protein
MNVKMQFVCEKVSMESSRRFYNINEYMNCESEHLLFTNGA